jgi:hypothetical protein
MGKNSFVSFLLIFLGQYFKVGSWIAQSVKRLAVGWMTEGSEFEFRLSQEFSFLYSVQTSSETNLGFFPWGYNRPGREPKHSPSTSAEVKKTWLHTSTPPYVLWRSAYLSTGTIPFWHFKMEHDRFLSRATGLNISSRATAPTVTCRRTAGASGVPLQVLFLRAPLQSERDKDVRASSRAPY